MDEWILPGGLAVGDKTVENDGRVPDTKTEVVNEDERSLEQKFVLANPDAGMSKRFFIAIIINCYYTGDTLKVEDKEEARQTMVFNDNDDKEGLVEPNKGPLSQKNNRFNFRKNEYKKDTQDEQQGDEQIKMTPPESAKNDPVVLNKRNILSIQMYQQIIFKFIFIFILLCEF